MPVVSPLAFDDLLPALNLLFGHLPPGDALAMAATSLRQIEREPALLKGLFGAYEAGELCGAVWCQPQAGRMASLVGPAKRAAAPAAVLAELLAAAQGHAAACRMRLLQAQLVDTDHTLAELLLAAGFPQIAELLYLVSLSEGFPAAPPELACELVPYAATDAERFGRLLEATYVGTQDCPALNGVRDSQDVLAGYLAGGSSGAGHWYGLRAEGRDVGCLLLADYPELDQWELVYLGLTPEVRGRGWGLELTRFAQWLARQAGRARLVLAVDAANEPALRTYAAAGFVAWNRRSVFGRVLAE